MHVNFISWGSRIFSGVSQFLLIRYLIQSLGVDLYAALAVINSFSLWLMLSDLGFGSAIQNIYTKYSANDYMRREILRAVFRLQLILSLLCIPSAILLTPFVGRFLFSSHFSLDLATLISAFVFSNVVWVITALGTIYYKLLYSDGKGHLSNLLPALASFVSLLLVYYLSVSDLPISVRFYWSVVSISAPQLVAVCLSLLLFAKKVSPISQPVASQPDFRLRKIVGQAFQFLLVSLLVQATLNVDYLILARLSTSVDIAQYKIVNSLYAFLYSLIYASLLLFWPICSRYLSEGKFSLVWSKLFRIVRLGWLSIFVVFVFVFLFRAQLSSLLSGGEVSLSPLLILFFALLYSARLIGDAFAIALASINKTKIPLMYLPFQLILGLLASISLASHFGALGVVFGLFAAFCLTHSWINIWYFRRMEMHYYSSGALI